MSILLVWNAITQHKETLAWIRPWAAWSHFEAGLCSPSVVPSNSNFSIHLKHQIWLKYFEQAFLSEFLICWGLCRSLWEMGLWCLSCCTGVSWTDGWRVTWSKGCLFLSVLIGICKTVWKIFMISLYYMYSNTFFSFFSFFPCQAYISMIYMYKEGI